ncbi:MAG: alpha/beta hydrolase domain-containing protein [Chloroflexota bacterium]|nr:alpha/beta hydrolase domain-containing protein [Chloroflexota bacterium]
MLQVVRGVGAAALLVGALLGRPAPGSASPVDADAAPDPSHAVLHVTARSVVADGHAFGSAGAYERLVGSMDFRLDPTDPRNAVITDLRYAPRDSHGLVAYSTDVYLLRPVDPAGWNHKLVYEVNNRGNKLLFAALQDTAVNNDPTALSDFGNGFLLNQGYALVWAGWEGDRLPATGVLTIRVPTAHQPDGSAIAQRIAVEYTDDLNFPPNGAVNCLPLSGSPAFYTYPAVGADMLSAQLWARPSDSSRPPDVGIPWGTPVPRDQWSFADSTHLCLRGGFQGGQNYELQYLAQDPLVLGLGYAATRDVLAFLRNRPTDAAGTPNPLAEGGGVQHVLGWGASQSGAYLRDYLYQGFNEDLAGHRVMDGVQVHIGGALLGQGENYRFGQLNPWSDQHRDRIYPNVTFPFNYGVRDNPLVRNGSLAGVPTDGILKRPTDPVVIQTDSSAEYWWGAAGLVDTDGFGHDVALPTNARHYLIAGTQHFVVAGATPVRGICQQPNNPTSQAPALRALFAALDGWATAGIEPPSSLRPTVGDGTLVPPDTGSVGFPALPGVAYSGAYNEAGEKDYGLGVGQNRGIITNWHPTFRATYRVLVPRSDALGIDLGGLRVPQVGVPAATLTGWNLRGEASTVGDLCGLNGMDVPLPATRALAAAAGDPRPSLEMLYGSHAGYVDAMSRYVEGQVGARTLLREDADRAVQQAAASGVLVR